MNVLMISDSEDALDTSGKEMSNKCLTSINKCLTRSNKKLLESK